MVSKSPVVFENGTMLGSMGHEASHPKPQLHPLVISEIMISSPQSGQSLQSIREGSRSLPEMYRSNGSKLLEPINSDEANAERGGLLGSQQRDRDTESDPEILESSVCSEQRVCASHCLQDSQAAHPSSLTLDMLNSSACSRLDSESRQGQRTRRMALKAKGKCSSREIAAPATASAAVVDGYPPQYTTIFLDHRHQHEASALPANAQLPATSLALTGTAGAGADPTSYLQYHQYCQQRPGMGGVGLGLAHRNQHNLLHHTHRTLYDVAVPLVGSGVENGYHLNSTGIDLTAISNGELSRGYSFRKWFARPSLPFVIGIFALGGVACTLGGIVLGSTGLIEHSTQYLSAALLMIGIGVSLLVISGTIWRLSLPEDVDDCPCFRRLETHRNCNSPHCTSRLLPGYLYPEFQHRPPPPTYLTSLNEYTLFYYPNAHSVGMNTPPPLYRSTYSLNTSASVILPTGSSLPRTDEHPLEDQPASVPKKETVSQTSFQQLAIPEIPESGPLLGEIETPTTYKDAELD
ncbi:hypothetical protein KR009_008971 [Drosophila setifemur]|nr:hypothetical protein KR009_008971 [Drosophila setifemur]